MTQRPGRALQVVLGDVPLPAPTRRRHGWAVRAGTETLRGGIVGSAVSALRLRRHLFPAGPPEVVLEAAASAGCTVDGDAVQVRDGGLLIPVDHDGDPAMMRLVVADDPATRSGLARHVDALHHLGPLHTAVPALLHDGVHGTLRVVVESRLPGRAPAAPTPRVVGQVAAALAQCDAVGTRDRTGGRDASALPAALVGSILDRMPDLAAAEVLRPLADRAESGLAGVPTGLQHGDLWHRNLLVARGSLTGILDWDSWRTDGLPAADLLGLATTAVRLRHGRPIGRAVADRSWHDAADLLARADLADLDVDAVGIVWWLTSLDGTLRRMPWKATDREWVESAVMAARNARWR